MVRKFFAVQLIVLFVLIEGLSLTLYSFTRIYLDERLLDEKIISRSYEPVVDVASHELFVEAHMDERQLAAWFQKVLPRESYLDILDTAIAPFFALFSTREEVLIIDLVPLKERIAREFPLMIERLPVCTEAAYQRTNATFPLCISPTQDPFELQNYWQTILNTQLPPRLHLTHAREVRQALIFIRSALLPVSVAIGVVLVASIGLLMGSSSARRLRWMAQPFVFLSLVLAGLSILLWKIDVYFSLLPLLLSSPRVFLACTAGAAFFIWLSLSLLAHGISKSSTK